MQCLSSITQWNYSEKLEAREAVRLALGPGEPEGGSAVREGEAEGEGGEEYQSRVRSHGLLNLRADHAAYFPSGFQAYRWAISHSQAVLVMVTSCRTIARKCRVMVARAE